MAGASASRNWVIRSATSLADGSEKSAGWMAPMTVVP